MLITTQRTINKIEKLTVEVELPYYYKIESLEDCYCYRYGRIDNTTHTQIEYKKYPNSVGYTTIVNIKSESVQFHSLGECLFEKYKSNETEYLEAKEKVLKIFYG